MEQCSVTLLPLVKPRAVQTACPFSAEVDVDDLSD